MINNKKNRPLASSALGPNLQSKAAGRKTPRPQRQSKIPAERDDGQNHGLNIAILPPSACQCCSAQKPPVIYHHKRSGALEADLAAELGRNAQAQPTEVMLRRSDRISKQKERMSTSTSSAALSSVVILQPAPFPRSKAKGRVAGTKPTSWGKPREISQTRLPSLSPPTSYLP